MKKTVDTSNDRLYCTSRKKRVVLQICKCPEVGTEVAGFPPRVVRAPAQFVGNLGHGRWHHNLPWDLRPHDSPTRLPQPFSNAFTYRVLGVGRTGGDLEVAANCHAQKSPLKQI